MRTSRSRLSTIACWVLVALLILLAFGLRVAGTSKTFGHGDEITAVRIALEFGWQRDLRPASFTFPAFYYYVLACLDLAYFVVGTASGVFNNLQDFALQYLVAPRPFYLLGRSISVVSGSLCVLAVYLLGKRIGDRKTGVFAALLLTVSVTHVEFSHWALIDSLMVLLATVSLLAAYSIVQYGSLRGYILCGVFTGLAIGTKYNAIVFFPSLFVAHVVRKCWPANGVRGIQRKQRVHWKQTVLDAAGLLMDKRLLVGCATLVLAFVLVNPYWVIDFGRYATSIAETSVKLEIGHGFAFGGRDSPLWYILSLLETELIIGFLFVLGVVAGVIRRSKWDVLALTIAVPAYVAANLFSVKALRYLLPLFPLLAVQTASMLTWFLRTRVAIQYLVLVCALTPSIVKVIQIDRQMCLPDTRDLASVWIEENVPPGSRIAMPMWWYNTTNPPLSGYGDGNSIVYVKGRAWSLSTLAAYDSRLQEGVEEFLESVPTYELSDLQFRDVNTLREDVVEYIALSSLTYDRYLLNDPPVPDHPFYSEFLRRRGYYEALLHSEMLRRVKQISPGSHVSGPVVIVFEIL